MNGAAVDGLVYVSATLGTPLPGQSARNIPVILVNRHIDSAEVDVVVSTTAVAANSWPKHCSSWVTDALRSSMDRERDDEPRPRARLPRAAEDLRRPARRDVAPGRAIHAPQRLPVVPRPACSRASADCAVRRQRRDRLRRPRRRTPGRHQGSERALDCRLLDIDMAGLGRLQPHHLSASRLPRWNERTAKRDRAHHVRRRGLCRGHASFLVGPRRDTLAPAPTA